MQSSVKLGILTTIFLVSSAAFAVNPIEGWYGGIILGGSYTPNVSRSFSYPATLSDGTTRVLQGTATLDYSILGNIGVSAGYRWCDKYRVEAEFLYNNNPYKKLTFTGDTRQLAVTMGAGSLVKSNGDSLAWNFKGSTTTMGLLVNGFYDFIPSNPESSTAPYIGFGAGYAYVMNSLSFSCVENGSNACSIASGRKFRQPSSNLSTFGGQGIIGWSVYLDDFSSFGIDLRYFTTLAKSKEFDKPTQILSFNFGFKGNYDAG